MGADLATGERKYIFIQLQMDFAGIIIERASGGL